MYFCVGLCIFVLFYVFLCCSMYFLCCSMYFLRYSMYVLRYSMYFCVVLCILCCSIYFCVVLCIFCVGLCIVCFVSFSVLFVCICVLYYCHRVATQLQLTNISYHNKQCKLSVRLPSHGSFLHPRCVCINIYAYRTCRLLPIVYWLLSIRFILKVKVKFTLLLTTKAQRGSGGIALLFL